MKCGYDRCIDTLKDLDPELQTCYTLLFITPWILILLGIYFYEVLIFITQIIPQQFGVRKHPLFFLPSFGNKSGKKAYPNKKVDSIEEVVEKMVNKDEVELDINNYDEEIKNEILTIKSLKDDKKNYPLICDALTKIYYTDNKEKKALSNLNILLKNNEIFGLLG
jgi:ATP-binding cassette subfamily A (ABC1) protein 3